MHSDRPYGGPRGGGYFDYRGSKIDWGCDPREVPAMSAPAERPEVPPISQPPVTAVPGSQPDSLPRDEIESLRSRIRALEEECRRQDETINDLERQLKDERRTT